MVGHHPGKLLLMASLVVLTSREAVDAQTFVRPHEAKHVAQPQCGFQPCPTNREFGYFRENWRRWPGDKGAVLSGDLTPFVIPDRSVPDTVVPNSRDEASQVQRERKPIDAAPSDLDPRASVKPEPAPGPAPPSTEPGNGFTLPGDLPSDTQTEGVFPSGDLPAEAPGQAFPSGDLIESDLDEEPGLPEDDENIFAPDSETDSDPLNELPGLDSNEGEIDLPGDDTGYDLDLGLNLPTRDHASVNPIQRPTQPAATAPRQINLVSAQSLADEVHVHVRSERARRNPLRRSLKARYATQRKPQRQPETRGPQTQKVAPASYVQPAVVKPTSSRSNPLR